MFSRQFSIILLFTVISSTAFSQSGTENEEYFASPLHIPLFLSGNFGEIRSLHFHTGLDLKTQQVTGKPVYAAADGYVSRIKIQASSYGKSLYITHPNGLTTVYGHLSNYIPEIAEYVKQTQYRDEKFQVDIYPEPGTFVVKKGQLIAISGNSGNSEGPHLHFEIRDKAERPLNGLLYHFNIADNIPPDIENLAIYVMDTNSYVNGKNEKFILKPVKRNSVYTINNSLKVSGNIGFGVESTDYLNGSSNKCGVYSIEMMVDDSIYYYDERESFSFDEMGYVDSYVDYEENIRHNLKINKLYRDPNNKLDIYRILKNEGVVKFKDDSVHSVKITIKDAYKNTSILEFRVKSDTAKPMGYIKPDTGFIKTFYYDQVSTYENPDCKIRIPENILYTNINFKYSRVKDDKITRYSDVHTVHSMYVPIYNQYDIALKARNIDDYLQSKVLIMYINEDNKPVSMGGTWKDGFVETKTGYFGKFYIAVDTIAPKIIPEVFKDNMSFNENDTLTFQITDSISGIKSYAAKIDNKWALFEYDLKTNTIFYVIDKKRLSSDAKHEIEITVTDNKENKSSFIGKFGVR